MTVDVVSLDPGRMAPTRLTDIEGVVAPPVRPVHEVDAHVTEPAGGVVLTPHTRPAPPAVEVVGEGVKGAVVHTAVSVAVALTRPAVVVLDLVPAAERLVVVQWLALPTLKRTSERTLCTLEAVLS